MIKEETMEYNEYLSFKNLDIQTNGIEIDESKINPILFDFQKDIIIWALKKGKSAIFADCGMGKTFMQLEWAKHIGGNILIIAPLAVNLQTKNEGIKLNIDVNLCESQSDVKNGINITNYEKIHKYDLDYFDGIVLDESSILKSYNGKYRNDLINGCKTIKYKLCCTATPAPNDYMELGNHSEFLDVKTRKEMLSMYFIHDSGETQKWRLKGHAEDKYWRWMSRWAVMIRKPSDLEYDDGDFILPEIEIHEHIIKSEKRFDGNLFIQVAQTLQERQQARKLTIDDRVEGASKIIDDREWLIWCNLNEESDKLKKNINGAIEIKGSDTQKHKETSMLGFSNGDIKYLVTKPRIAGFGMNWQHCNNMVFVGLSDSYEQYYQAVRRCWRFGQTKKVNVHIVTADTEGSVIENIKRKERDAINMAEKMTENMAELSTVEIHTHKEQNESYNCNLITGDDYQLYHGDCIEEIKKVDSVDYSIFSPPFAELYTYSDSNRDMGNSKNYNDFFQHFKYLSNELYRITKPGRLVSIHCIDIPAMKERDGYLGIKDFPGDLIRLFQESGFIYHSRVTIWKNPLIEATRTKALGLMHKQLCKDSSLCRQGLPDYLITMRKKGENENPIQNGDGLTSFIGNDEPKENGIKYSHEVWRRYASPVWMDINQSNTLNKTQAREKRDEKHICPLQLDVIARGIELWSSEGDTIFSPFMGIGSEGYKAIEMDRKFIGIELKESYYNEAVKNISNARALTKSQINMFA